MDIYCCVQSCMYLELICLLLEVTALCSFRGNTLTQIETPKSRVKIHWICPMLEKSEDVESQMKVRLISAAEPHNCSKEE
jgi:hypothetical protein